MDKLLKKIEMGNFIITALKSILKLVKLQSLFAKRCKTRKIYSPAKLAFLYTFVLRTEVVLRTELI